jgi:anti-anti-sigma factor
VVEFRESDRGDGGCVMWVEGEFDLAVVDEFLERALAALDRCQTLELDLGGVSFIDSSGLGALVRVRQEAAIRGKTMSLVNVSAATHRLLQITGLHEAFDIRPDQA